VARCPAFAVLFERIAPQPSDCDGAAPRYRERLHLGQQLAKGKAARHLSGYTPRFTAIQAPLVLRSKLQAPAAYGFVGHHNTALNHEVFDVAETHGEPVVQPNGCADDFGWKTMTVVAIGRFHQLSLPYHW